MKEYERDLLLTIWNDYSHEPAKDQIPIRTIITYTYRLTLWAIYWHIVDKWIDELHWFEAGAKDLRWIVLTAKGATEIPFALDLGANYGFMA